MENVFEIYRAVVFPWHCDHIGHMNVRWYAHHFDDAGFPVGSGWDEVNIPDLRDENAVAGGPGAKGRAGGGEV